MVTRIRKLLEQKQLTPTQFADLIGVGRPVMSHILSERNKPSLEVVQRIISAFPELSLPWLLSGTGEMLAAGATEPATVPEQEGSPLLEANPPIAQPTDSDVAPVPPVAVAVSAPQPPYLAKEPALAASPELSMPQAAEVSLAAVAAAQLPAMPYSSPPAAPAANPSIAAPKPFRAARLAPSASMPAAAPVAVAVAPKPASAAGPAVVTAVAPASVSSAAVTAPNAPEAAALSFLAEPGKAIRRIVIFYRDGSFADYQPEQ
jgi:transcriptional regulator with XRE-family HTH domain